MLNIRFFIVLAHVRGVTTNALRSCVIKVWQSILKRSVVECMRAVAVADTVNSLISGEILVFGHLKLKSNL